MVDSTVALRFSMCAVLLSCTALSSQLQGDALNNKCTKYKCTSLNTAASSVSFFAFDKPPVAAALLASLRSCLCACMHCAMCTSILNIWRMQPWNGWTNALGGACAGGPHKAAHTRQALLRHKIYVPANTTQHWSECHCK
ncbi:hypothetical protein COO60DRAFT_488073 [Scenedesmus sp. NREL 46B-D3]|nr:hypothetical protein COO60DRAFT_488073 [Scenedesmus sp. NREL 46B-D3]